jgi:hypothetical protein
MEELNMPAGVQHEYNPKHGYLVGFLSRLHGAVPLTSRWVSIPLWDPLEQKIVVSYRVQCTL